MIPVSELGSFVYKKQDDLIFHKDLADIEYVLGEPIGRLSAPIYAMFGVDDLLLEYQTVDGKQLQGEYLGPPEDQSVPSFEWGGEWTVTYETFRDMGTAFAVALVVIYMLVVWQFGNFIVPAVIMAPIPLTLLGIVPLAYSCTVKSTNKIELRTIIPARAIQPIIEVAVNSAPNSQCPGTIPNRVSGIGAIMTAGTMKLPNCQTTNIIKNASYYDYCFCIGWRLKRYFV
jgi:hypothetical protein